MPLATNNFLLLYKPTWSIWSDRSWSSVHWTASVSVSALESEISKISLSFLRLTATVLRCVLRAPQAVYVDTRKMLMVIIGESSERAAIASDLYVRTAECWKDTKGHLQNFGVSIRCYTEFGGKQGYWCVWVKQILIRYKFVFLFSCRKPTTWPANNSLQIIICICAIASNCVWLQIIFCSFMNETSLSSFLREKWQIASLPEDIH